MSKKVVLYPISYLKALILSSIDTFCTNTDTNDILCVGPEKYRRLDTAKIENLQKIEVISPQSIAMDNDNINQVIKEQIENIPSLPLMKILEENAVRPSYKEKHLKQNRPYVPRKIINLNFNSRKKGGR